MMSTTTGLTYDNLVALQSLPENEFRRLEIIDGELFVSPAPIPFHQIWIYNFAILLGPCVVRRRLGQLMPAPVDLHLSPHDVVEPDVVFVRRDRLHIIDPSGIKGVPDLVVEVLSKSTRRRDLTTKKTLYERYGVPEYWIVDLEARAVNVFALVDGTYQPVPIIDGIIRSTVIPDCTVALADLFDLQSYQQ
jgi:Uma2 family endonuclease